LIWTMPDETLRRSRLRLRLPGFASAMITS
jgi:hypothetical protein